MKRNVLLPFLNIVIYAAFIWSTFESITLLVIKGSTRLVNSSLFCFLSKFGINLHLVPSFKVYFNLKELFRFFIFWLQMNLTYTLIFISIAITIVFIFWILSMLKKEDLRVSNVLFSFFGLIFFILLWRLGWFRLRPLIILYLFIFFILFLKFSDFKISLPKRLSLTLSIIIVIIMFISLLVIVAINIQDSFLLYKASSCVNEFPNIVLISIDSLRSDHLGCYGYVRNTTPNIDKLADDGVLFWSAISTSTWTLPAHISLLTSLSPEVHQVINDGIQLSKNANVFSEILKQENYLTAGFVSGPYVRSEFGFSQGFDLYDDYTVYHSSLQASHRGITSPRLHKRLEKWLKKNYNNSFFLFIHYWDVHYDYNPPPPYNILFDPNYKGDVSGEHFERNDQINSSMPEEDLRHLIALYDGEIAFTDFYIGELMRYLKVLHIYDNALIVLTSDHGDEFFEHGEKGHRKNLFDETLKVPLIIKFPSNRWKQKYIHNQVQIIDIVPTLLSYLSFKWNHKTQGKDLMPLITGEIADFDTRRFADLHGHLKCVRNTEVKYIVNLDNEKQGKLFLLDKDMGDKNEVLISNPILIESMHTTLMEWLQSAEILAMKLGKGEFKYEENLKNQLKSLGYIQ